MLSIKIEGSTLAELREQVAVLYADFNQNVPLGTPEKAVAVEPTAPESGPEEQTPEAPAKPKRIRKKKGTKKVAGRELPAAATETKGNGKADPEVPSDYDLNEMARGYAVKHGFEIVREYLSELGVERITAMSDDQKIKFFAALSEAPK